MEKPFLKIREAAVQIGVTPLTLRNWHRRGILVPVRNPYNNYRLYRREDISAFIATFAATSMPTSVPTPIGRSVPDEPVPVPPIIRPESRVQKIAVRYEDDLSDANAPATVDGVARGSPPTIVHEA